MLPLLERMSNGLGLSVFTLAELVRTAPYRYKVFRIPKRSGELRTIAQPTKIVKVIQRWLIAEELHDLPIHQAAVAYKPGAKIRANAEIHARSSFLLKMDFADFFPSITDRDLKIHLRRFGHDRWNDQEIGVIANLVLWLPKRTRDRRLQLCVGGSSSPFISNTVMYDFDAAVSELCAVSGVAYTRYADDLAFSTDIPRILSGVEERIGTILREMPYPRLGLNPEKTIHSSKGHLRRVTGLTLTPEGHVSIGRERKRAIRAKLHHFLQGQLTAEEAAELNGLLAFSMDAEPDFVMRLRRKFGDESIKQVMSINRRAKT